MASTDDNWAIVGKKSNGVIIQWRGGEGNAYINQSSDVPQRFTQKLDGKVALLAPRLPQRRCRRAVLLPFERRRRPGRPCPNLSRNTPHVDYRRRPLNLRLDSENHRRLPPQPVKVAPTRYPLADVELPHGSAPDHPIPGIRHRR